MRARRCTATLAVAALAVAAAAGCGGGGDDAVSVPTAPGAPLTERVLAADQMGINGFAGSGDAVEAQSAADFLAGDCAEERDRSLEVLEANDLQAVARRGFSAADGGGLSAVWQFAAPSGAAAWQEEVLRQGEDPVPECVPDDVTRTGFETTPVAGLPDGTAMHVTQTGPSGPSEAWNVLFTDGRFSNVVGAIGPPGAVTEQMVVEAAKRQWARRSG